VHVSYDQGDSIQETKQITVADIALTGGFDAALPANIHEGETADVVYTLRNNTGGTATNIQYTLGLTDVSEITNNCGPSLAAHSTCSISGTYTAPSNAGVKSLSVGVSYDQGNALQNSTQTMVADIALTGSFSKALPSNIHEGKKASITYTLSNNTGGTATNIQYTLGLTDVSDITNNCGPSLAAHSTCSISGTYTAPSNAGVKSLSVGVSYDQGDDIQDTTQTTVADIALTGAFDRALPANIYEGETADVVYTLSNNTGGTATNIQYTLGLTDVSGITTNCGSSLSAHTSCSISGTYIAPSNVGVKSLSVGVSYDQGNALQNTTQTTVADIALTGSFSEALPANMHEGESAPVTFTLTNSTGGEATNIQYALGLTDMDITTNDCGSTLAANSICTISGTYTAPNNLGVRSLSVDVSYDQGNAFQVTSQTTIADVALTGSFSKALPAELAKGETASVEFTLTNSTGGEAKNIQYTFGFTDVSSVVNNCNGTLAANSLCKITGTYTAPDSLGVQSISVGVSYDQGNPISETSQTTVIANATTMSAPSGTVNFAPNETTDIVVTNDGAGNASNVQITLPSEISDHLAGGSTTSCASVASGGGTCTFVLPMDGSFSAPGSLDDLTVAGSNTNTLTLSSQAQDTLVTAPGITLTQPSNNYVLTVTNAGNSALSGFSLNATLPSGVTQESTTCTSTLAADSDCTYTYSATNTTSSSDTTLTFTYTVGGVQKSLVSNLVVPQTTVAINPDDSDVGQDIDADLAGGHFTIKNTGNYVWHLKTPSTDSVTRDGADSWLTLNTTGAQADPNCSDVSTVSPGNSCNVNYTIASPFDYSAVVTASGLNISNTSQNLEPNAHVSIGIEGDNVERHLKYRSVVVTNLASATVTLSNITDPSPNANIALCDKTGTPSANCPTAYLSSCFNGATIAAGEHCLLWFYAKDSDSLSANTTPQAANISVTATPDGGSAATVTRSVDFVYGNRLYIAGDYDTSAGGVANTKYLAYWDGANWNAINGSQGPNNNTIAVYAYQGDIYIGGTFTSVDNVSGSAGIAKWDGESWSSLGSGMTSPNVRAIQAYQSNLYIAGNFSQVGGVDNTEKIARWDGASWHSVGTNFGSGGAVRVMVVYDNKLVIAGALNNINGINHDKIATWDGSSWAPLDSNVRFSKRLQALYVDPDTNTLYIGGFFGSSNITGVSDASGLVSYNGSTWSNVGAAKPSGGGVQTTVNAITSFDSHINISGVFNSVGGNSINHVAQWDGTTWSSMGANGADSFAAVFRVLGNQLYAGGVFTQVGNLTNIFAIARWDGSAWHAVGGNIQSSAANTGIDSLQIMPYLDLQ
jgi:prophage DNA circulation protein